MQRVELPDIIVLNPESMRPYVENTYHSRVDAPEILKQFNEITNDFFNILRNVKPSRWGFAFTRKLHKIIEAPDIDQKIKKFIETHAVLLWDVFNTPIREGSIYKTAIHAIHHLKEKLPIPDHEKCILKNISLKELMQKIPSIKLYNKNIEINGAKHKISVLEDKYDSENIVTIPLMKGVWHKGGAARYILKRYFESRFLPKEVPIRDWDILVKNTKNGNTFMQIVGENDLSGIEIFSDLEFVMSCRDVTMNLCVFGVDGLTYLEEAATAVKTGIIRPCGGDHGLYGKDFFYHQGEKFFKPRVFERLIKFVIEGKAERFRVKINDLQFYIGITLLLAFTRVLGKKDAAERIEKIYFLLDQMGQLEKYKYVFKNKFDYQKETLDVFDLLEYTHRIYSFVKMENRGKDDGVAFWLIKKLIKWYKDLFKRTYNVHDSDLSFIKCDYPEEIEFSLDNFISNPEMIKQINEWIPCFLEHCRARNAGQFCN